MSDAGCVFAEDEADLLVEAAASDDELGRMVERRVAGTPLEHVLGWADFCGLRIRVDVGVFVPRRRTELLVDEALQHASHHRSTVVVDLCCGTGAVGTALVAQSDHVQLYAVDIDPRAVRCAQRNLTSQASSVYQGDLFAPLPRELRGRVDVVVANAPYVPSDAVELLPPEARDHESGVALDGGLDGLEVIRRIANEAADWLAGDGVLLVESSKRQSPEVSALFAKNRLTPSIVRSETLDATVVIGRAQR